MSNNILGARPDHPFWHMMTEQLIPWGYHYPLPYVAVSYASGQWFETAIWEEYHKTLNENSRAEDRIYRIMMDQRPGADRWVFFTSGRGGSWTQWDNSLFSFIGNVMFPWLKRNFIWLCLGLGAFVALVWYLRRRRLRRGGYKKVGGDERQESHELLVG